MRMIRLMICQKQTHSFFTLNTQENIWITTAPEDVIIGSFPTVGTLSHPQQCMAKVKCTSLIKTTHIWVGSVV